MRTEINTAGLRRELARRGMSQAELAAIAGLSEATVSHAASGRPVSCITIKKLARGLWVTPIMPGADGIVLVKDCSRTASPSPVELLPQADPDQIQTEADLARRVASKRAEHFARMAYRSPRSRSTKRADRSATTARKTEVAHSDRGGSESASSVAS
ncbi:MAG: helix-turn-helix domain-containing protein [Candidatus Dormibacteria bacterium]